MQNLKLGAQGVPPVTKSNLAEVAYEAIKRAIMENTYRPGHQLGEMEIASQLGMSRTPVHEAVARLQEEGFVRILPKRGILVLALSPDDIHDIYDVIIGLEGAAAERIAEQPKAQRASIAQSLELHTAEMESALSAGNRTAWARADMAFHGLLADRCENERLRRMVGTVTDQLHRVRLFTLHLRPPPVRSARDHAEITAAIRNGTATDAAEAARRHRQLARDELLPLLRELNLRNL